MFSLTQKSEVRRGRKSDVNLLGFRKIFGVPGRVRSGTDGIGWDRAGMDG